MKMGVMLDNANWVTTNLGCSGSVSKVLLC